MSPEIDPHMWVYSQLIFDKGAKAKQWNKDNFFNKWCWNNWTYTYKQMNLATDLTSFTKISSKWIIDLNVKHKVIKLLAYNIGKKS